MGSSSFSNEALAIDLPERSAVSAFRLVQSGVDLVGRGQDRE